MNHRLRVRNDLILGGSVGPEAGAKLNAWAGYENALSQLGKAERKVDELTPPPGVTAGKPSPALTEALDDLGIQRVEVAKAEAKLDELGIDATRTRTQINALTGGIFGEHGLGGGPRPHPQPETRAVPAVDKGKGTADLADAEPVPAVDKGRGTAGSTDFEPVPMAGKGKGKGTAADVADFGPVPHVDKGKGRAGNADFEPVPTIDKGKAKADFADSADFGPVPETHLPRPRRRTASATPPVPASATGPRPGTRSSPVARAARRPTCGSVPGSGTSRPRSTSPGPRARWTGWCPGRATPARPSRPRRPSTRSTT
ncbi:hypothetical protein [Streptomyces sp. Ac-502]|uniref:hypothetical protein n=1 Tax=Streptomyces sp. Ac-502 TaxID=3342801 RepID=UPI003862B625